MSVKGLLKRPIKPGKRYWDRVLGAIRSPERLLVELITNSIDSYKRLRSKGKEASGLVQITYKVLKGGEAKIKVKDEAEGIPFKKLQTIVEEYGEDSSGLSEGLPVRGTIGVGLKDVGLLMQDCRIITICDDKLNECNIYREKGLPFASYPVINRWVTSQERKKLGIEKNGTIVEGTLPKDPSFFRDFKTLYKHLCLHYMLRKINQLSKLYRVILKDQNNQKDLKYTPPKGEVLSDKLLYIPYTVGNFPIKVSIKKAERRLGQSGEFREGGLIVIYNDDAVADCSLFGFDADSYARPLFGEVNIQAQASKVAKLFDPAQPIIDEKRKSGLDPEHPFVQLLSSELQKQLRTIIEKEREAKKGLKGSVIKSRNTRKEIISKFNAMARKELKEKKNVVILPLPPYWTLPEPPDFFKFYYDNLNIMQYQKTIVGLGILPDKVSDGTSIIISSNNPSIEVTPGIVFVDSTKAIAGLIRERITLVGKKCGVQGTITAEHNGSADEIKVTVTNNPLLNPKNGFAFIPDRMNIPNGKRKKADLIIDRALVKQGTPGKVSFVSSTPNIRCPSEIRVMPGRNIIGNKTLRLPAPLKGYKVGTKGTVSASYKQKEATIDIDVIKRREIKGMFSDFKFSREELPLLSEYDPETGIITIYVTHPMYKKHREMGKPSSRVFVVDTIIRTACEAIVREGIKRQSARYPTLGAMSTETFGGFQFISEVSLRVEELYHTHGSSLCELLRHISLNLP